MAEDKKSSKDFHTQESEREAKEKVKRAEKTKTAKKASKNFKAKTAAAAKKFRKFWRDFFGEIKKIVWPDFKTVMKSTGLVLATVLIIGIFVWILDFGLTQGVRALKNAAEATSPATTQDATAETTLAVPTTEAVTVAETAETTTVTQS
ncbi:MAG: preprotein translocase subunit SecE [Oscillospiraceae bacterium]|jgi:preprotein translocase subunit SecE|nr:preprotein translocase subunit SecE [Oscillospiraceae bacterium]